MPKWSENSIGFKAKGGREKVTGERRGRDRKTGRSAERRGATSTKINGSKLEKRTRKRRHDPGSTEEPIIEKEQGQRADSGWTYREEKVEGDKGPMVHRRKY